MDKKIQEHFRNQFPLLFACFVCMIFFFNPGTIFADSFNVNISGPTTVAVGTPVQYSAPAIDNADYVWIFGNGTPNAAGSTVSHTFTSSGNWNVSVDVYVNASPPSEGRGSINVTVIQAVINNISTVYPPLSFDPLAYNYTECNIQVNAEGDPSGGNNITITAIPKPEIGISVTPSSASSSSSNNPYNNVLLPVSGYFVPNYGEMTNCPFQIKASYTDGGATSTVSQPYTTPNE